MRRRFVKLGALALVGILGISSICGCKSGKTDNKKENETKVEESKLPVLDVWDGVKVKSTGNSKDEAVIQGTGILVVEDTETKSNVLKLEGKDGMLILPKTLWKDAKEGFSISYKYKAAADCSDTSNLFQTNIGGFGIGDTYWRDAPEISLNATGMIKVFVGGRTINGTYSATATYNNGVGGDDLAYAEPGGHKTRFTGQIPAPQKDVWNEVIISVAKDALNVYINGTKQDISVPTATDDITSSLEYLFGSYDGGEFVLGDYVNSSIGGSVYNDVAAFSGMVDDICIFNKALTDDEAKKLPKADYMWNFDNASIVADTEVKGSDLTKYQGEVKLTEVSNLKTTSPDGKTIVQIWNDNEGKFYYSVTDDGVVIVESSLIGMDIKEGDLTKGLSLENSSINESKIDETYELFTGMSQSFTNNCNEKSFLLKNDKGSFTFVIRAYDDGVAYRYLDVTAGEGEKVQVNDEKSEIILPDGATTWAFALNATYEGEYVKRTNSGLKSLTQLLSTPMLANVGEHWIMITEAAAINNNGEFATSGLQTVAGSDSLMWTFGLKRDPKKEATGELDSPGHLNITEVNTINKFDTPWRAMVISKDMNELTNSSLITDLNPTYDKELFGDLSYIKPGKVAWSWWSEGDLQGDYNKHIEYIDFAAENGWEYVCLDVGWRAFESRLSEMCKYAADKGIGLFVWVNYRDIKDSKQMENLFKTWKDAGAVGLKTDYFESDDTDVLKVMEDVAICSAKNQLMLVYHGCVRPGGENRTYPNILTTEAVQGQEWHKWFAYPTVENCLMYPFTRNICGSMDFTPVATKVGSNESTHGFGLAQGIVYESALQHFAYAASAYKNYTGLALLNNIPTTWDESKLIEGYPGEYITVVRRNANDWFVGSMTLEKRNVDVKLDFLGDGTYNAYIYGDDANGTSLVYKKIEVKKGDILKLNLLANGGAAVMITKGEIDTTVGENSAFNNPNFTYYEAEATGNTLAGTAAKASSAFCSGGQKVGYVGNGAGNTLTFNGINVEKDGTYKVMLFYCSGENRKVTFTVNADKEYVLEGLNSGDYVHPAVTEIEIELKKGENTITLSNASYYAPDIDRIAVSKTE